MYSRKGSVIDIAKIRPIYSSEIYHPLSTSSTATKYKTLLHAVITKQRE